MIEARCARPAPIGFGTVPGHGDDYGVLRAGALAHYRTASRVSCLRAVAACREMPVVGSMTMVSVLPRCELAP
jgi:hypothetical protein